MRSAFLFTSVSAVLVVACGRAASSPSGTTETGATTVAPPSGPCGVRLFRDVACQGALDSVCCPLETECARDANCLRLSQCINGCKGQGAGHVRENCINGCAMQSHHAYCQSACQDQRPGCVQSCLNQSSPASPMVKWTMIADCSKGVNYPPGTRCDDDS